jgi:ubiquinone/menaquinone biosynthesis C-methylase UbiE
LASALSLPVAPESADRILLSGTLQSLDADAALAECARVIKPGGLVVVSVLGDHPFVRRLYRGKRGTRRALLKAAGAPDTYESFREEYQKRYFVTREFAPEELTALMAKHGFALQESHWIPGALAGFLVDSLYLLFWRRGNLRWRWTSFVSLFPFLSLLQSMGRKKTGLEWVACFRAKYGN